jgi:hypothetical protein
MDENEPLEWYERLCLQVFMVYAIAVVGGIWLTPLFLIISSLKR